MKTLPVHLIEGLVILALMACNSQKQPTAPQWNDARELIFGSSLEIYGSIYRLDVLTGAKQRIPVSGHYPLLSPKGEQLAFYANYRPDSRGSATALYISNLDGSDAKRVAHISGPDTLLFAGFDWSADSKKIVYSSPRASGIYQIYVFDFENNREYRLATDGHAWDPHFSPGGDKISYVAILRGEQSGGVYVMNADGSNQHLFTGQELTSQPRWAADGKEIVFSKKRAPSLTLNSDIFLCDASESNRVQLTFDGKSTAIAWSPSGQEILFLSERDGTRDLYIMDKDGKNQSRITTEMNANVLARWSPKGEMIVFGVDEPRDGEVPLYLWRSGQPLKSLQVWVGGSFSWLQKK